MEIDIFVAEILTEMCEKAAQTVGEIYDNTLQGIENAIENNDFTNEDVNSDLKQKIIDQVEYYFSDVNLVYDRLLLSEIRKSENGWVSLNFLLKFNQLKTLCMDPQTIAFALENSKFLEVSSNWSMVRRKLDNPIPNFDRNWKNGMRERTVIVQRLPINTNFNEFYAYIRSFFPHGSIQKVVWPKPFIFLQCRSAFITFSTKELAEKFLNDNNVNSYKENLFEKIFHLDYFKKKNIQKREENSSFKKNLNVERENFIKLLNEWYENGVVGEEKTKKMDDFKKECMERLEKKLDEMGIEEYRREKFRKMAISDIHKSTTLDIKWRLEKSRTEKLFVGKPKGEIKNRKHVFFVDSDEEVQLVPQDSTNPARQTLENSNVTLVPSSNIQNIQIGSVIQPPKKTTKTQVLSKPKENSIQQSEENAIKNSIHGCQLSPICISSSDSSSENDDLLAQPIPTNPALEKSKNGQTQNRGSASTSQSSSDESVIMLDQTAQNSSAEIFDQLLSSHPFRPGLILKIENLPYVIDKSHLRQHFCTINGYFKNIKKVGKIADITLEAAFNTAYIRFESTEDNYAHLFWKEFHALSLLNSSIVKYRGKILTGTVLDGEEEAAFWGEFFHQQRTPKQAPIIRKIKKIKSKLNAEKTRLDRIQHRTNELKAAGWGNFVNFNEDHTENQSLSENSNVSDHEKMNYLASQNGLVVRNGCIGVEQDGVFKPFNGKLVNGRQKGDVSKKKHIFFADSDEEEPQNLAQPSRNLPNTSATKNNRVVVLITSSSDSSDSDSFHRPLPKNSNISTIPLKKFVKPVAISLQESSSSDSSSSDSETPGQILINPRVKQLPHYRKMQERKLKKPSSTSKKSSSKNSDIQEIPIEKGERAISVGIQDLGSANNENIGNLASKNMNKQIFGLEEEAMSETSVTEPIMQKNLVSTQGTTHTTLDDPTTSNLTDLVSNDPAETDQTQTAEPMVSNVLSIGGQYHPDPTTSDSSITGTNKNRKLGPIPTKLSDPNCTKSSSNSDVISKKQNLLLETLQNSKPRVLGKSTSKLNGTAELVTKYDFYGQEVIDYYTQIGYYTSKINQVSVNSDAVENSNVPGDVIGTSEATMATPQYSAQTIRCMNNRMSDQTAATPLRRSRRLSDKISALTTQTPTSTKSTNFPKQDSKSVPTTSKSAQKRRTSNLSASTPKKVAKVDKPEILLRRSTRNIIPVKRYTATKNGPPNIYS